MRLGGSLESRGGTALIGVTHASGENGTELHIHRIGLHIGYML